MQDTSPWHKEVKTRQGQGRRRTEVQFNMDPALKQALQEMAESETILHEEYVSRSTVAADLLIRSGSYFTTKRRELKRRYEQLKRESTT